MLQTHRLFMIGLIVAMLGIQLRVVDHFILNERVSALVERHAPSQSAARDAEILVSYSPYDEPLQAVPARRTVRPPEWLGWSLLSVGVVLILTCPIFR